MSIQKTLAAGIVALTALAAATPAQADSFSFGIYGQNGSVTFSTGDTHYRPAHYRDYRPRDHRRWDYANYRMTPRQVSRSLRRRGFEHIRFTDSYGRIYRATATTSHGRRVALTIRSRDARILEMHRIRRHRHG